MKCFKHFLMAMLATMSLGLVACSDDDNDELSVHPSVPGELVSPTVPTTQGWSGDFQNGVAKYVATDDYDDEEPIAYMAFSFENGICKDGAVNVVMPNENDAKLLEDMLKNGTWAEDVDDDDDDDDYYCDYDFYSDGFSSFHDICSYSSFLKSNHKITKVVSRASQSEVLPINVYRKGNVVYMSIPNISGLTAEEVKGAIDLWSYNGVYVPAKVVFGKYENGVYTCDNMHGIGLDYRIDTQFDNNGVCTKFLTTISFPYRGWAQLYYEEWTESFATQNYYYELFGMPTVTINGNKVSIEAVIVGEPKQSDAEKYIIAIDWMNNCPILWELFE